MLTKCTFTLLFCSVYGFALNGRGSQSQQRRSPLILSVLSSENTQFGRQDPSGGPAATPPVPPATEPDSQTQQDASPPAPANDPDVAQAQGTRPDTGKVPSRNAPSPPSPGPPSRTPSKEEAKESADKDDLFKKEKKKEIPADLSEYCDSGGNLDPACNVNAPVKALKDEINDVFKHIRQMMADKKAEKEKSKAEHKEQEQDDESTAKAVARESDSPEKQKSKGEGEEGDSQESGTETDEKKSEGEEADKESSSDTAQTEQKKKGDEADKGARDGDHEKEKEKEDKQATGATNTEETKNHIVKEGENIEAQITNLESVKIQLKKDGKLDRELDHEMGNLIMNAKLMRDNFKAVENANDDEAMMKALDRLEKDTLKTAESVNSLVTGVAPNEWKWWRYRYEYSFVESACLICVVLLAMILDLGHHSVQTHIFEPDAQRRWATFQSVAGSNVMKRRWLCLLFGELSVLGLVQFTIWLLAHLEFFSLIPTQSLYLPGMHLPRNEKEYSGMIEDVFVHLFISIILYYLLVGTIMRASEHRIVLWEDCQEMTTPREVPEIKKKQFVMLQKYFSDCLLGDRKLWTECGSPRGEDISKFPFSKYLSWCVRDRVEDHLCIRTHMWFGIALTLTLFCWMNYYHIAFLQITAVMTIFVFLCIGAMAFQVYRVRRSIVKYSERPKHEKDTTDHHTSWIKGGDFYMAKLLQFLLFFTCYGCARIVASPFMWTLYPIMASALVTAFILFYALFVMVFSEVFPEFAALMSIPPYVGTDKAVQFAALLKSDADLMIKQANTLGASMEGATGTFNLQRPGPVKK